MVCASLPMSVGDFCHPVPARSISPFCTWTGSFLNLGNEKWGAVAGADGSLHVFLMVVSHL